MFSLSFGTDYQLYTFLISDDFKMYRLPNIILLNVKKIVFALNISITNQAMSVLVCTVIWYLLIIFLYMTQLA